MVIKIHKSSAQCASSLLYNTRKVEKDVADVLHVENTGGITDVNMIGDMFRERECKSFREIKRSSFQMSLNPGENDTVREEDIPALVRDIMEGLGYGDQPWVIFKHRDIGRTHYHVVSTSINENGRKISDSYTHRKLQGLMGKLGLKYGFINGGQNRKNSRTHRSRLVFRQGETNVMDSIDACIQDSLRYHFTTEEQFLSILRCHRVTASWGTEVDNASYVFYGLDEYGRNCTQPLNDGLMNHRYYDEVMARCQERMAADMDKERKRLGGLLKKVTGSVGKYDGLVRVLSSMNIDIVLHRDDRDKPCGITLIDHDSMCAFEGTELSREATKAIMELAEAFDARKEEREMEKLLEESGRDFDNDAAIESDDNLSLSTLANAIASALAGASGGESNSADLRRKKRKKKGEEKKKTTPGMS